jgi:chromosome segregation ATPase
MDQLEYAINRMEAAAQADEPSKAGYGKERKELLDGIAALRAEKEGLERGVLAMGAANDALRAEAEKDYEDMRRFQTAFIEADHERIALRDEVTELKEELKLANSEFRLLQARLHFNPLPNDNMIHSESEIRKLYADLAAAVEVLRKIATHPIYGIDPIEIVQIARAFLARMEVKP